MPTQPSNKTAEVVIENSGYGTLNFYPSGSYYTDTGSAAPDVASYDIIVPYTLAGNFITNTGIQPYIKFELMSASNSAGSRFNPNVPWDFYIRFFTGSHFVNKQNRTFDGDDDIGKLKSYTEIGTPAGSQSLYYTGSSPRSWYRDVLYEQNMTGLQLRDAIYNIITGSLFHFNGAISASKHQDEVDDETGIVNNYSCSIFFTQFRGLRNEPEYFTGSLNSETSPLSNQIKDGSGSEVPPAAPQLIEASASMQIGIDPLDGVSFKMSVGTSSLAQSGSNEKTVLYASGGIGGEGRLGFGTTNPKTKFDIKSDGFKVRSEDGVRELIFEKDGRLAAKKYSGTASSESIGGIIQLSYTPGTFDSPTIAREEETIGTINFVDESLNKLNLELAFDDVEQKYQTSASVAQITSTVKFAEPSVGVIGNLEFKVSPVPSAETALERIAKSKEQLQTFMEINPLLSVPVYFPSAISSSLGVYAKDLILDYDNLPTSDPNQKGRVYRNGSNQLFISAG